MSLAPLNWFIPMSVTFGGWLGGGLSTMAGLFQDTTPKTPRTTTVRIWVGMDPVSSNRDKSSIAGPLPMINLFDERGQSLGGAWTEDPIVSVPEGGFRDYFREQENNVRPAYLQLSSIADWNMDAVCMSAIAVMYPDGGQASILGDVPHGFCGWQGYPSLTEIDFEGKGTPYRPFCFWLDKDDSYPHESSQWNPISHKALTMHFHLPDFNGQNDTTVAYNENRDLLCKSSGRMLARRCLERSFPIFDPPLNYGNQAGDLEKPNHLDPKFTVDSEVGEWPQSKGGPGSIRTCAPKLRKRAKRKEFEGQWVHSHETRPQFSATEICKMPGLRGPHYANVHERKFCNVDDRSIWDICDERTTSNCFDVEKEELLGDEEAPIDPTTGLVVFGVTPRPKKILTLSKRRDMV